MHKWLHYFDIYERHLARFQGKSARLLEIGVDAGGSLVMWRDWLSSSRIVGLDKNPDCVWRGSDGIDIVIGDQADEDALQRALDIHRGLDIVIDDGSHFPGQTIASFEYLYPQLAQCGVYIVEDTHACYWPEYGGGLKEYTFIEYAKAKIDELHAWHSRGQVPVTDFTRSTQSITVYDSMVVFEKCPQGQRHSLFTGAM